MKPISEGAVVTIGNFDGVHLGHQALLGEAVSRGRAAGIPSVALTFWPHPLKVLSPETPLVLLTSSEEKIRLIGQTGIDLLYCADFDRPFSQQSAEGFVRSFLVEKIRSRDVIVGYNFAFGKNRGGKTEDLVEMGKRYGFAVHVQKPVEVDGIRVSSSTIRSALEQGKVALAARLLGRPYSLQGEVIPGEKRGTALGFPTANLRPPADLALPLSGVYAAWASRPDAKPIPAAAYVGPRPTFGVGELFIEAHLLSPTDSLYGTVLSVSFVEFVRPDEKFDDGAALARQMALDIEKVRRILGEGR